MRTLFFLALLAMSGCGLPLVSAPTKAIVALPHMGNNCRGNTFVLMVHPLKNLPLRVKRGDACYRIAGERTVRSSFVISWKEGGVCHVELVSVSDLRTKGIYTPEDC